MTFLYNTWQRCHQYQSCQLMKLDDISFIDIISLSTAMENIYLNTVTEFNHEIAKINRISYQPATNSLLLLHNQQHITKYVYHPKNNTLSKTYTIGPIEQLEKGTALLLEELVDDQNVLVVCDDGTIFTVSNSGDVDVKAQNEDGISAATLSPTQEYLYLVTKNQSLIQLNKQFDLVNQIPLDPQEKVVSSSAQFSWRADGNFFALNYETVNGHKCITKDQMMADSISPAKSDTNSEGLVQSVSQKGRQAMEATIAWQPSGSIIAGVDFLLKGEIKLYRIIFWQKNGLRHLQFNLPSSTASVQQLFWSPDSTVLFVRVITSQGKSELLLYYRSNYHWFLKNIAKLASDDLCCSLSSLRQKHKLLIVSKNKFQILQYQLRLPEKQWKLQLMEQQYRNEFVYFVDGSIVKITDFSKSLIPPPMSLYEYNFGSNIVGIFKKKHNLLVVVQNSVILFDLLKKQLINKCEIGDLKNKRVFALRLLQTNKIVLSMNNIKFIQEQGQLKQKQILQPQKFDYFFKSEDEEFNLQVSYQNKQLRINGNTISEQCSSFTFYHQFLLFTVSTSSMYDKLFVINLVLDEWIEQADSNVKSKLSEIEAKELLHHRLVERGSKIIAVTEGRVVFQLPRGNLQGIYPKIIMINQVRKYIKRKQYRLAFETIRTHKLDFNLLYDINPEQFVEEIQLVLAELKRVDFINLLIAQVTETYSSEMLYILKSKIYDSNLNQFQLSGKGKKIKSICRIISETLRRVNKQEYILSIFTSEIKEGKLNNVLFQIKEMKQNEVHVVIPPHLSNEEMKKAKRVISSQQILEYVCWLVDANAIYEASLLTYDLELAAITARCTQKDPKQYIPYIQSLKLIKDPIQFRKQICMDLKKYEIAAKQLALGDQNQRNESLKLIKKHKLYKQGLIIYSGKGQLSQVKQFMVEELLTTGQTNQAYRVCQSIGLHERALSIAKGSMDTKKIKQCLQIIYPTKQERIKIAYSILNDLKDQIKNRIDLARLYAYVGEYEEAVTIYLRHFEYRKAYKYLWNVKEEFRNKQMKEGFQLCFSVKRNDIIKDKKDFLQKIGRLKKVHKHKAEFGQVVNFKPRENDDMYSEVSVSSKAQSSYTISTTTGMRKKKDKKRSILTRNVKEGSLLEQQYLLAYLKSLQDKVEDAVKESKLLIQHLICMGLIEQAEAMRNQVKQYLQLFNTYTIKSYARTKFEQLHPEAIELYYQPKRFQNISIDSFNYLF